jgi:hypothetical protein
MTSKVEERSSRELKQIKMIVWPWARAGRSAVSWKKHAGGSGARADSSGRDTMESTPPSQRWKRKVSSVWERKGRELEQAHESRLRQWMTGRVDPFDVVREERLITSWVLWSELKRLRKKSNGPNEPWAYGLFNEKRTNFSELMGFKPTNRPIRKEIRLYFVTGKNSYRRSWPLWRELRACMAKLWTDLCIIKEDKFPAKEVYELRHLCYDDPKHQRVRHWQTCPIGQEWVTSKIGTSQPKRKSMDRDVPNWVMEEAMIGPMGIFELWMNFLEDKSLAKKWFIS